MHQFALEMTVFVDEGEGDHHDDKTIKRHQQMSARQIKRTIAATIFAIVIGFFLVRNFRNIAFHAAQSGDSRSLRNTNPMDSNTTEPGIVTTKEVVEDLSPIKDATVTFPKPEALKNKADWPPTALLDDLFLDTPIAQRRLVVAAANVDFVDFADNFANSLLKLNVTNFVLVPLDGDAYRVLHEAYPEHTVPVMPGLDTTNHVVHVKNFASKEFKQLTSSRPQFLKLFLEKGYTVFYNDIDMVWTQNAWEAIDNFSKKDTTVGLLWHDGPHQICTCMMYMSPTPEIFSLLTRWQEEIETDQHQNDQGALIKVAQDMGLSANQKNATVQVFKNSAEFPHGQKYFGRPNEAPSEETMKNRVRAVIVHNNWIGGKQKKRDRFEAFGLWNPSGKLPGTTMHVVRS